MPRRLLSLFMLSLTLHAAASDHASPKLFIGGGGVMGSVNESFTELTGPAARLVVIPNPDGPPDPAAIEKKWNDRGYDQIYVLHAPDRATADTASFAGQLQFADAVWIDGGVQQRYAARYADTRVEAELIALLNRGGVIGGSSAGASLQTKAMICGGTQHPEIREGLDLLQGAIVDQHFLRRNRLPRLIDAVRNHPDLVGYGIDEGTALVVRDGRMQVTGQSYVIRIKMVDDRLRIDAFRSGDTLPLPRNEPR